MSREGSRDLPASTSGRVAAARGGGNGFLQSPLARMQEFIGNVARPSELPSFQERPRSGGAIMTTLWQGPEDSGGGTGPGQTWGAMPAGKRGPGNHLYPARLGRAPDMNLKSLPQLSDRRFSPSWLAQEVPPIKHPAVLEPLPRPGLPTAARTATQFLSATDAKPQATPSPLGLNVGVAPDVRVFISAEELRDLGLPSISVEKLNVALAALSRGLDTRTLTSTAEVWMAMLLACKEALALGSLEELMEIGTAHGHGLSSFLPRLWLSMMHHVLYKLRAKPQGETYDEVGQVLETMAQRLGIHVAVAKQAAETAEAEMTGGAKTNTRGYRKMVSELQGQLDRVSEDNARLAAHARMMAEELSAAREDMASVVAVWGDIAWLQDRQDQVAGLNRLPARVSELSHRLHRSIQRADEVAGEHERAMEANEALRGQVGSLQKEVQERTAQAGRLRAEVEAGAAMVKSQEEGRVRIMEQLEQTDRDLEVQTRDATQAAAIGAELGKQLDLSQEAQRRAEAELAEAQERERELSAQLREARTVAQDMEIQVRRLELLRAKDAEETAHVKALFAEMDPEARDLVGGFERALKKAEDKALKWVKRMKLLGTDLETAKKVELHEVRQSMQLVRREVHASVEQVWAWSRDTVRRALAASVGLVQARESTIESFKTQLAQTEAQMVAERTRFQGRIGDLEVLLAAANRTINERDEEIVGLRKEISDLNAQAKRLEAELDREVQERERCEGVIRELEQMIAELRKSEEALYQLQVELKALRQEHAEVLGKAERLEALASAQADELVEARAERERARERAVDAERDLFITKRAAEAALSEQERLASALSKTTQEYAKEKALRQSAEAECNRLSKKLDRIKSSGMEKMALKYKELLEKVLNAKVGALKAAADAPGPIEYPKGGFSSRSPLVLDDEGHRSPDPTHQPNPASAVAAEMLGEIEDAGGPASALMKERAEQTLAARRARSEAQLEIPEDLLDDDPLSKLSDQQLLNLVEGRDLNYGLPQPRQEGRPAYHPMTQDQVASGAAPGPAVFDTAGQDAPRPPLHPAPPPPAPAFASPAPVRSSADVFAEASEGGVPGRLHISVQAPRTSRGHLRGVPEGAPSETFSDAVSDVFNPNLMDHPLVKLVDAIEPAMPEVDKYRVFRVPLQDGWGSWQVDELNFLVIRGLQANFPGILIPPLPPNLVVPKEGEARPAAPRMALPAAAPPALFMLERRVKGVAKWTERHLDRRTALPMASRNVNADSEILEDIALQADMSLPRVPAHIVVTDPTVRAQFSKPNYGGPDGDRGGGASIRSPGQRSPRRPRPMSPHQEDLEVVPRSASLDSGAVRPMPAGQQGRGRRLGGKRMFVGVGHLKNQRQSSDGAIGLPQMDEW